jgi:hypothetical protein
MKNYSISDKISVVLAWMLIHVIIGIVSIYVYDICVNDIAYYSVFMAATFAHYKWASKMIVETEKILGF